jgi:hypothetical protein
MAFPSKSIHLLQSMDFTGNLGSHHQHCSYVVGYIFPHDAVYTTRHISKNAKVDMLSYVPKLETQVVNSDKGKQALIILENPQPIIISKEETPEFEWITEEVSIESFFGFPLLFNLGLILPFEKIDETKETITYTSYIVDPIVDIDMFRYGLEVNGMDVDI